MKLQAYPLAWARHEAVRQAATRWLRRRWISPAQHAAIEAAHPLDFFRPHPLLRALLFGFTWFAGASASALWGAATQFHVPSLAVMSALGGLVALELFIRSARFYRAGPDAALLYMVLGWLIFLIGYAIESDAPSGLYGSAETLWLLRRTLPPVLLLLLATTVRYADRLVAGGAFLTYLLWLAVLLLGFDAGRLVLPFALMLACVAAYGLIRRLEHQLGQLRSYYRASLQTVQASVLICFYLAGNYLVVREGNAALSDGYEPVSRQIPLAGVFYFLTAAVPLLYIYVGLRRHNRLWLIVGLLALAFSGYTLRHYRSLLPPEIAATFLGAALIVLVLVLLRYLRTPRHGLTVTADADQPPPFDLEALVVAETAPAPVAAEAPGLQFGGGQSGGGGAEGAY